MDKQLDKQLIAAGELKEENRRTKVPHFGPRTDIFEQDVLARGAAVRTLLLGRLPFQRYAPNFLEVTLGVDAESAARLFSCFPILAMILTPFLGRCSTSRVRGRHDADDRRHHHDGLPPELRVPAAALPLAVAGADAGRSRSASRSRCTRGAVALGTENHRRKDTGLSLLPDILDTEHRPVSAPLLIGKALDATGGYTTPMMIFSSFGVLAFIFSFYLKLGTQERLRSGTAQHQEINEADETSRELCRKVPGFFVTACLAATAPYYKARQCGCTSPPTKNGAAPRCNSRGTAPRPRVRRYAR